MNQDARAHMAHDLTGVRVGTETVVQVAGSDPHYGRIWLLDCDCGATRTLPALRINATVKRGKTGGCPECPGGTVAKADKPKRKRPEEADHPDVAAARVSLENAPPGRRAEALAHLRRVVLAPRAKAVPPGRPPAERLLGEKRPSKWDANPAPDRPTYDQRQVAKVFADLFAVFTPNPPKVQKTRPFGNGSRSRHEGKVVAGWLVVREAGWQRMHGRLCRVWLCRCAGCGIESNKSTAILGVMHAKSMHAKSPADSAGCKRCADARRRVPDSERICQWCSRSTIGQKQPRECGACNRRAMRNGRDDEGRPLGRVSEKCREGQARRKAARVRAPGEKKAAS